MGHSRDAGAQSVSGGFGIGEQRVFRRKAEARIAIQRMGAFDIGPAVDNAIARANFAGAPEAFKRGFETAAEDGGFNSSEAAVVALD